MVYQTPKPFVTNVPVLVVLSWLGYISYMTCKPPEGEKGVVLIFCHFQCLVLSYMCMHSQRTFVE